MEPTKPLSLLLPCLVFLTGPDGRPSGGDTLFSCFLKEDCPFKELFSELPEELLAAGEAREAEVLETSTPPTKTGWTSIICVGSGVIGGLIFFKNGWFFKLEILTYSYGVTFC